MRRVRITATGKPADVLELVDFDAPAPGPGQALVEVQAANASDFLYMSGPVSVAELPCGTDNGPYLVEGTVQLYDTAGTKVPTEDRAKIALCRCGASSTKPFCDGSHSRIGFQAVER